MSLSINVFLSAGQTRSQEQEQFIAAVQSLLRAHHMVPRTVGRTEFTSRQPLIRVTEVLRECSGTIIVALERLHFEKGIEFRHSREAAELAKVSLPTVWNQIEAGIAYALGLPLLAIVETGLRKEGLLEDGYDWYVDQIDVNPSSLATPEFLRTFAAWKTSVEKHRAEHFPKCYNPWS